jgi:hypothetical protein
MANHEANTVLQSFHILPIPSKVIQLTPTSASELRAALVKDADHYATNALISIGEAIQGVRLSTYGWSLIQLYYATFYLCRTKLALDGVAIFYSGKTPYLIEAIAGSTPSRKSGTTHEVALNAFSAYYKSDILLGQDIAGKAPLAWLKEQREHNNYKYAVMGDPNPCPGLTEITEKNLRGYIVSYLEVGSTFSFDTGHAALAWPLQLFSQIIEKRKKIARADSTTFSTAKRNLLTKLFRDSSGPIAILNSLVLDFYGTD